MDNLKKLQNKNTRFMWFASEDKIINIYESFDYLSFVIWDFGLEIFEAVSFVV